MKAIQFDASIPRYAAGLLLGKAWPEILWNGLSCTRFADTPEPALPGPDWVKIRTRYGGICGSDISTVRLHTSPYFSPFTSFPFVPGHENAGRIAAAGPAVQGWKAGERAAVEPLLWCAPRGCPGPCRFCARGEINLCERTADGALSPGLFIGGCRDTGGSWGEYFTAHASQLYRVPAAVSDENAVMADPLAVGLHAALSRLPADDETVLVLGCGIAGVCVIAALRALGVRAKIVAAARYPFQAEAAERYGATHVLSARRGEDLSAQAARLTGARLFTPIVGKYAASGGADVTYECAGSDASLDDALRLTRSRGRVVVVGMPAVTKSVDWTAAFAKELDVRPVYAYHHAEDLGGKKVSAFGLALDLMARGLDLGPLVTHRFPLEEYRRAFRLFSRRGSARVMKAVFAFD